MKTIDRIGFIGGGQMAKALAGGAVRAGLLKPEQLMIAEPNSQQKTQLRSLLGGVELCDHGHEILAACDRVVLAVKPQVLQVIGGEMASKLSRDICSSPSQPDFAESIAKIVRY